MLNIRVKLAEDLSTIFIFEDIRGQKTKTGCLNLAYNFLVSFLFREIWEKIRSGKHFLVALIDVDYSRWL